MLEAAKFLGFPTHLSTLQEEIPVIYIPYLESSTSEPAAGPIALDTPKPRDGREPLRHILLGSQAGVEKAVKRMQVLNYAEQFLWSREIEVPETGILIMPNQGEVLRCLVRWRAIA